MLSILVLIRWQPPTLINGDSAPTLDNPSSETTWGKRDAPTTNEIDFTQPSTVITWGKKRDLVFGAPVNTIKLGKPSTTITWDKRDDKFTLGEPTTDVTWGKHEQLKDVFELGDASTKVTWS
jgi:hypothetical protein